MQERVNSPIWYSPPPLHIHNDSLSLDLLTIGHLVGRLHVILVLKFNECIATGFPCTKDAHQLEDDETVTWLSFVKLM